MEPEETVIEPQVEDVEPTEVEETVESLQAKLAESEEAKRQLTARAKKAEEEAKKNRPKVTKQEEAPQDIWEIAEMIQNGYTREDADFIAKNGGKEALTDPNSYVSIAMTAKREQRRAETASDQTGRQTGMSEVERKYTTEQLNNMSADELAKLLPHADPQ